MSKSVRVTLSPELAELLGGTGAALDVRVHEALVLMLFQEGSISSGKAAQLLNMTKESFRQLLVKREVPYFQQSLQDVLRDAHIASSFTPD